MSNRYQAITWTNGDPFQQCIMQHDIYKSSTLLGGWKRSCGSHYLIISDCGCPKGGSFFPDLLITLRWHDIVMGMMASQITGISIVCSTVGLDADQRKHQSSMSLAFVKEIHQWLGNSQHKIPGVGVTKAPFINFSTTRNFDFAKV